MIITSKIKVIKPDPLIYDSLQFDSSIASHSSMTSSILCRKALPAAAAALTANFASSGEFMRYDACNDRQQHVLRYDWRSCSTRTLCEAKPPKAIHPNIVTMKNAGLVNLFTKIRGETIS